MVSPHTHTRRYILVNVYSTLSVEVPRAMPLQGSSALSLLLKKGHDRRREDELLRAFTEADKNGDGYLSVEEYVSVFRGHGISISQEEVMLFFNSKDRDRDGRISYEEFCDRETVNERAFKAMDLNNDGYITKSEMLKASNRGSRRSVSNASGR